MTRVDLIKVSNNVQIGGIPYELYLVKIDGSPIAFMITQDRYVDDIRGLLERVPPPIAVATVRFASLYSITAARHDLNAVDAIRTQVSNAVDTLKGVTCSEEEDWYGRRVYVCRGPNPWSGAITFVDAEGIFINPVVLKPPDEDDPLFTAVYVELRIPTLPNEHDVVNPLTVDPEGLAELISELLKASPDDIDYVVNGLRDAYVYTALANGVPDSVPLIERLEPTNQNDVLDSVEKVVRAQRLPGRDALWRMGLCSSVGGAINVCAYPMRIVSDGYGTLDALLVYVSRDGEEPRLLLAAYVNGVSDEELVEAGRRIARALARVIENCVGDPMIDDPISVTEGVAQLIMDDYDPPSASRGTLDKGVRILEELASQGFPARVAIVKGDEGEVAIAAASVDDKPAFLLVSKDRALFTRNLLKWLIDEPNLFLKDTKYALKEATENEDLANSVGLLITKMVAASEELPPQIRETVDELLSEALLASAQ